MDKIRQINGDEGPPSVRPKRDAIRPFRLQMPLTSPEEDLSALDIGPVGESQEPDRGSERSDPVFPKMGQAATVPSSRPARFVPVSQSRQASVPLVPLQFRSLKEALEGCRDMHPLPFELIIGKAPHHTTWLTAQVKKANSEQALHKLAYGLDYRDLSMLFTALLTMKRREETDQIQNLIRIRACHYLYICGWLTLQQSYPRSSVARALADLCIILEDVNFVRDSNRQDKRRQLALPLVPIGHGRIIWSRVPLISAISLPNSRHFISDIAKEIYESKIELNAFLHRYAIFPGLPLGDAIAARYEEMVTGVSANPLLSQDFFDRFRGSRP